MDADRVKRIEERLAHLVDDTAANLAMLLNQSGDIVARCGNTEREDIKALAALLTATFFSSRDVAKLLKERDFRTMFQKGIKENIFTELIRERWLLVVIFDRRTHIGLIKVLAKRATDELNVILGEENGPGGGGGSLMGGGPFGGGGGPLGRFDDWAVIQPEEKEQL